MSGHLPRRHWGSSAHKPHLSPGRRAWHQSELAFPTFACLACDECTNREVWGGEGSQCNESAVRWLFAGSVNVWVCPRALAPPALQDSHCLPSLRQTSERAQHPQSPLATGSAWEVPDAKAAGRCRWVSGCGYASCVFESLVAAIFHPHFYQGETETQR